MTQPQCSVADSVATGSCAAILVTLKDIGAQVHLPQTILIRSYLVL